MGRAWTDEDDVILKAGYRDGNIANLAKQLGRTPLAVRQRARKTFGLDSGRYYTDEERQIVRQFYPTETAEEVSQRIYGTARYFYRIHRLAENMGVTKAPHWPQEVVDRVRELNAAGLTDREIARRMNDVFKPGVIGGYQARNIRSRLGLPTNSDAILAAKKVSIATQAKTLKIKPGGQLRVYGFAKFARNNGWPDDLPPRAIQILNVLAEHGPKTAAELASAIGQKPRTNSVTRRPMYLLCSRNSALCKGHGTYTGLLMSMGFVHYQIRSKGVGSGKCGRIPGLYLLTAKAITIREECLERIKREDGPVTTEASLKTSRVAGTDASTHRRRRVG